MNTCEICGKEIIQKKYKRTCSKKCSQIYIKKSMREYQKKIRQKCKEIGLSIEEWKALRKKEREKAKSKNKVRIWYDKGLYVDWSKEEFEKIKMCKDKAHV